MAEIHIIGQILCATKFPKQSLFCKWNIQYGNNWRIISGNTEGQTQVDSSDFNDICYWYFPLDIHFATKGVQGTLRVPQYNQTYRTGWPKIHIQVFHLDWVQRVHLFGYGFVPIPTSSGFHNLECYTWRPIGSLSERISQYFLGGGGQLKYPDLIFSSAERYKLKTETMGQVTFELGIVFRNFEKFGLEYK